MCGVADELLVLWLCLWGLHIRLSLQTFFINEARTAFLFVFLLMRRLLCWVDFCGHAKVRVVLEVFSCVFAFDIEEIF